MAKTNRIDQITTPGRVRLCVAHQLVRVAARIGWAGVCLAAFGQALARQALRIIPPRDKQPTFHSDNTLLPK
jgi:hypothetical protein